MKWELEIDGDCSGSHDGVDEPVIAPRHGNVVDPDVGSAEEGYAITIAPGPQTNMVHGVSERTTGFGHNVLDVKVHDDDVVHILESDATTKSDDNVGSSTINGLVAGHHQLLL